MFLVIIELFQQNTIGIQTTRSLQVKISHIFQWDMFTSIFLRVNLPFALLRCISTHPCAKSDLFFTRSPRVTWGMRPLVQSRANLWLNSWWSVYGDKCLQLSPQGETWRKYPDVQVILYDFICFDLDLSKIESSHICARKQVNKKTRSSLPANVKYSQCDCDQWLMWLMYKKKKTAPQKPSDHPLGYQVTTWSFIILIPGGFQLGKWGVAQ